MRTLVVGSGGREHALCWKLSQECEVICAPGNPGIAQDVEVVPIPVSNRSALVELAVSRSVDLVVVGPEDPLIAGLADDLRTAGIAVFGPEVAAAQLEGSKEFSKAAMISAGIPTAQHASFSSYSEALVYLRQRYDLGLPQVIKASGAALGRGVFVPEHQAVAEENLHAMMGGRQFGQAGDTVVIEDCLSGREFSLLTLVGDNNFVSLPISQDYKRALDNDEGLNTGGMGTFSPCGWASESLVQEVEARMVKPMIHSLNSQGIPYRGVLYTGVMVTADGPKCLEYNVRFGDPETQTVMRRLGTGFLNSLQQAATGQTIEAPSVLADAAVTVVVASTGYPGPFEKGLTVSVGAVPPTAKIFFAGVTGTPEAMMTSGGRVVACSATGATIEEARSAAYQAAASVNFAGARFRKDIAAN